MWQLGPSASTTQYCHSDLCNTSEEEEEEEEEVTEEEEAVTGNFTFRIVTEQSDTGPRSSPGYDGQQMRKQLVNDCTRPLEDLPELDWMETTHPADWLDRLSQHTRLIQV